MYKSRLCASSPHVPTQGVRLIPGGQSREELQHQVDQFFAGRAVQRFGEQVGVDGLYAGALHGHRGRSVSPIPSRRGAPARLRSGRTVDDEGLSGATAGDR